MNIVLGFGSTEISIEDAEQKAFVQFVSGLRSRCAYGYFSDEIINETRAWLEARAKLSRDEAKTHDNNDDPPGRYTSFYARLVASVNDIVAIFDFSHINRKHAFSDDGWVMCQTTRLCHVRCLDLIMDYDNAKEGSK